MARVIALIVVLFFVSFPSACRAEDTARQFLSRCVNVKEIANPTGAAHDRFAAGYCAGELQGLIEGSAYSIGFLKGKRRLKDTQLVFCVPPDISKADLAAYLIAAGAENPQLLDEPAIQFISVALRMRFPCKEGTGHG